MTPHAYAVFDTETNGLFVKDVPETDPVQPRLASLSIVKASPTWATQSEQTIFIKPDGWTISPEVTAINGLTTEWLMEHGVPVRQAIDAWIDCIREGRVMAGFSVGYDVRIMRAELARANMPLLVDETLTLDAMTKCIGIIKLPLDGRRYKVPKLSEALAHFKIPQLGAHTSLGDTISTLRLLHRMSQIGIYLEPKTIPARKPIKPKEEDLFGDKPAKKGKKTRPGASWLRPETPD
jgi:DNA polymerase III epsilon subunit-like protein